MIKNIQQSRILFLDSDPLVRLLQMNPEYYPVVSSVLDMVYEKNIQLFVSSVTLYEISAKACAAGDKVLARQYREFFENSSNVNMIPVTGEVASKAAELAAQHNLSTEESLRLASAYVCGADCILTEKSSWKDFSDALVVTLDEL